MIVDLNLSPYFDGCVFPSENRESNPLTDLYTYSETIKIQWWWNYWQYVQLDEWWYEDTEKGDPGNEYNWYCYVPVAGNYKNGYYSLGGPGSCHYEEDYFLCERCPPSIITFASPPGVIVIDGFFWTLGPVEVDLSDWQISVAGGPAARWYQTDVVIPGDMEHPSFVTNPHCPSLKIGTLQFLPWWTYVIPGQGFRVHDQPMRVYWMPDEYKFQAWQYTKGARAFMPPPPKMLLFPAWLAAASQGSMIGRRKKT